MLRKKYGLGSKKNKKFRKVAKKKNLKKSENMPTFLQKEKKDLFLTYNMSLFLKEENGRLALHNRFCESTMIMRQDEVTKAQKL